MVPSSLVTLQGDDISSRESTQHVPRQAVKRMQQQVCRKKKKKEAMVKNNNKKSWRHNVFFFPSLLCNKKVFSPVVLSGSRNCGGAGGGCCCLGCQVYFHCSRRTTARGLFPQSATFCPGVFPRFSRSLARLIRGEISIAVTVYCTFAHSPPIFPLRGLRSRALFSKQRLV